MRKAVDLLFYENSPTRLRDPHFLLTLESQMLFPQYSGDGITLPYAISLALHAGPYANPDEASYIDISPSRWEPSIYGPGEARRPQFFPPKSPLDPSTSDSYFTLERHTNWETYNPLKPLKPENLSIDLQKIEILRPYRIAIKQSESSLAVSRNSIRMGAAAGYIAAICLDMRRLISSGQLKTKTGRVAQPSKNLVPFVLEQYNLGRKKRRVGHPGENQNEYPTLDRKKIDTIWNKYEECVALWAAYRALSPHTFDSVPQRHLLEDIDGNEFFRLFMAYEAERRSLPSRQATRWTMALGPQAQYDELRQVAEQYVPTYRS
jgi:hypothetical protein